MTARRVSVAKGLWLFAAVLSVTACDALITEPATPEPGITVSFALEGAQLQTQAQGVATAFDRVNRVYLHLQRPDGSARDTVVAVSNRDGVARARLVLESKERVEALGVYAQLRAGLAPLFEGERVFRVALGEPTSVEVQLSPIPFALRADRSQLTLEAVGDTARLGTTLYFATGDTLAQNVGSWSSEDAQTVFVTAAGLAVARAAGETRLFTDFQGLMDTVVVRVNSGR